jgi:large subunit ribosomal protein L4
MQVPVYNTSGEKIKDIEISDLVFGVSFNEPLVHQVMVAQRANARQGTADTKTRTEVKGSSKKLYREKGTGNARMGSARSPSRRHGGVVFGPHPRDYSQNTPKKMRQSAIRCMLSSKISDGDFKIVDTFSFEQPKTKEIENILSALGTVRKTLLVDSKPEINFIKSARNIPNIKTLPANLLNVVDLLSYKTLVMTESAVRKAEEIWGKPETEEPKHAAL